jgi:hypothetical protein
MCYVYGRDENQIKAWVEASQTEETTQAYLDRYIYSVGDHAGYLNLVGKERLQSLKKMAAGDYDEQPCI